MDLYSLHSSPHELNHHDRAQTAVPKLLWNKMKDAPDELYKYEDIWAKDPVVAYNYSMQTGKRFKQGEEAIATHAQSSYRYASYALHGQRFRLGEPVLAKSGEYAYLYVQDVLGQEWPEAEHTIFTNDVDGAYMYLKMILKFNTRIPRIEKYILKDPYLANQYAQVAIGGRWPLGEATIKKNSRVWGDYQEFLERLK